jgi:ribosome-binding factor A
MKKERLEKLESLSLQLLPSIILEEIWKEAESEFWFITITKIKISPDLSYLDVFVSSIKKSEILTKFLAKENVKIQRRFNKSLDLRKLPRIRYRLDKSWEKSQGILNRIKEIEKQIK